MDLCYDCRAEVHILSNFLQTVREMSSTDSVALVAAIEQLSMEYVPLTWGWKA